MEIKNIKSLVGTVLVFIGLYIFFQALDLGVIGFVLMGVITGLFYFLQQKIAFNENIKLALSIVIFLLMAFSSRFLGLSSYDLQGLWKSKDDNGDELVFQFLDDSEVSVIVDEDQEDELIYEYKLSDNRLIFYSNDTVRFDWEITKLSKDYFEISQEGEVLKFKKK